MPHTGYDRIYERIEEEIPIEELTKEKVRQFLKATPKFPNRQRLADEVFIARSISLGLKYAKKMGIELNEKRTAKVEKWKKQDVIVIRETGRFLKWKRI